MSLPTVIHVDPNVAFLTLVADILEPCANVASLRQLKQAEGLQADIFIVAADIQEHDDGRKFAEELHRKGKRVLLVQSVPGSKPTNIPTLTKGIASSGLLPTLRSFVRENGTQLSK